MFSTNRDERTHWVWTLASIAIVVGALYLAKGILLPLIVAAMISFLLSPVCDWLEHHGFKRVPAVLMTVIITFLGVGVVALAAINQMSDLAPNLSRYQANVENKFKILNDHIGESLRKVTRTTRDISKKITEAEHAEESAEKSEHPYAVRVISSPPSPPEVFSGMFGTLMEALASAGIVLILVLFFLARREDLRDRFIRLVGQGKVTGTTHALGDAGVRVSRYLLAQSMINVSFGAIVTLGLWLIGVPNALLWGILTAALKFIPYIGVWIAAVAPFGMAMASSTGWTQPVLTISLYAVLEFIVGNFVEPLLFGKHTGISAVAILVAAVFWSWLWGGMGLLLSTPLTVCLLVIGKHVPQLAFLEILLGDEPVLPPPTRLYQRLLAGDYDEAAGLVAEQRQSMPVIDLYDTILIPALCMAENDRHRGEIDEERMRYIIGGIRNIIEETVESLPASNTTNSEESDEPAEEVETPPALAEDKPQVISIAADTPSDELVAVMFAHAAMHQGLASFALSLDDISRSPGLSPAAICLSTMPPIAVSRALSTRKQVVSRFRGVPIIYGLWQFAGDQEQALRRIGRKTTSSIATTLKAAIEQAQARINPPEPEAATAPEPAHEVVSAQ